MEVEWIRRFVIVGKYAVQIHLNWVKTIKSFCYTFRLQYANINYF